MYPIALKFDIWNKDRIRTASWKYFVSFTLYLQKNSIE